MRCSPPCFLIQVLFYNVTPPWLDLSRAHLKETFRMKRGGKKWVKHLLYLHLCGAKMSNPRHFKWLSVLSPSLKALMLTRAHAVMDT